MSPASLPPMDATGGPEVSLTAAQDSWSFLLTRVEFVLGSRCLHGRAPVIQARTEAPSTVGAGAGVSVQEEDPPVSETPCLCSAGRDQFRRLSQD